MLSIIIPCCGRLDHLKQTLPLLYQSAARCNFDMPKLAVVPWTDKETEKWAQEQGDDVIALCCIHRQHPFNLSRARNFGAMMAPGMLCSYVAFLDADMKVKPAFVPQLLELLTHDSYVRAYDFAKDKPVFCGFRACSWEAWFACDGYDPAAVGWGAEDRQFNAKLDALGLKPKNLDSKLLEPIPHDDALRVANYSEKNMKKSQMENRIRLDRNFQEWKARMGL